MSGPEIDLTGANVWPTGRNPLAEHVPGILRRVVQEAVGTWDGTDPLEAHIEAHAKRVLIECITAATVTRWERQAAKWEAVDLEVAAACRERAYLVRQYGIPGLAEDLDAVVSEQAQERWSRAA